VRVDKISVSFNIELGDAVRSAAAHAGQPLSSWLAEAAASKLRSEALAEFLATWESEHGPLTDEELARAERELSLPVRGAPTLGAPVRGTPALGAPVRGDGG
jgi:hypothetical protein